MRDITKAVILTFLVIVGLGVILFAGRASDPKPTLYTGPWQQCGTISLTVSGGTTSISSQENCFQPGVSPCYDIAGCTSTSASESP